MLTFSSAKDAEAENAVCSWTPMEALKRSLLFGHCCKDIILKDAGRNKQAAPVIAAEATAVPLSARIVGWGLLKKGRFLHKKRSDEGGQTEPVKSLLQDTDLGSIS